MKTDIQELRRLREQEKQVRELLVDIARRRRELIIRLADGGMDRMKIAAIYGITKQRVSQIILRGER